MGVDEDLAEAIARCVKELPSGHVRLLADRLAVVAGPQAARAVTTAVANEVFALCSTRMIDAWAADPSVPSISLALALRAASKAQQAEAGATSVTAVWTGPRTPAVPVRQTEQVLLELIAQAQQRLIMVSFAAYKVERLIDALAAAVRRGVDIRMVLETADAGVLEVDAAEAFRRIRRDVSTYVWPVDERKRHSDSDIVGRLHAKTAIADGKVALVTSANLTGYAMSHNMELGLRVEGPVAKRLDDHFMELIAHGVLEKA
jgi:phosphatidylserine/phosphatidylglycerophosphate/cardiolipin synthase-like enzyme